VAVDGHLVDTSSVLAIEIGDERVDALLSNGVVVPFEDGMAYSLTPGQVLTALAASAARSLWLHGPLSNCENSAGQSYDELGFGLVDARDGVVLSAAADSACVVFDLGRNLGVGELSLTMQSLSGKPARICVWSLAAGECVVTDTVESGGVAERSYLIDAEDRVEGLELFVYADGGADAITTAAYRDMMIRTLEPLGSTAFASNDRLAELPLGPGVHELAVTPRQRSVLGEFGELGDCSRSDDRSMAEVGLEALVGDPKVQGVDVELAAREHAACVQAPVRAAAGERVVIAFGYDQLTGAPARFCLWQTEVNSCAHAPLVDGSGRYRAEITIDPRASGVELFLYADGDGAAGTRIRYYDVTVTPALGLGLALEPAHDVAETTIQAGGVPGLMSGPIVAAEATSASTYEVQLRDVNGELVLVLPESYADGWRLDGLPSSWVAEHLMVDGYANGWRIQGQGSATLTLTYGPGELVRIANDVSPAALLAFFLYAAYTRRHSLMRRWRA
ncbi:MAG: hypothetical protein HKN26_02945, partial [Acidimicrobiales bacterium]|nr:hypothetical protein [Acidimicrobiales bacterium]